MTNRCILSIDDLRSVIISHKYLHDDLLKVLHFLHKHKHYRHECSSIEQDSLKCLRPISFVKEVLKNEKSNLAPFSSSKDVLAHTAWPAAWEEEESIRWITSPQANPLLSDTSWLLGLMFEKWLSVTHAGCQTGTREETGANIQIQHVCEDVHQWSKHHVKTNSWSKCFLIAFSIRNPLTGWTGNIVRFRFLTCFSLETCIAHLNPALS